MITTDEPGHVFDQVSLSQERYHDFGEKAIELATPASMTGGALVSFHMLQQLLPEVCLSAVV
jgi:hypothetical protein